MTKYGYVVLGNDGNCYFFHVEGGFVCPLIVVRFEKSWHGRMKKAEKELKWEQHREKVLRNIRSVFKMYGEIVIAKHRGNRMLFENKLDETPPITVVCVSKNGRDGVTEAIEITGKK